jgi:hypothetical protein
MPIRLIDQAIAAGLQPLLLAEAVRTLFGEDPPE